MPNNANSGVPRGQTSHGARDYLAIDGRPVGYIGSVQWTKNVAELPVEVLDDVLVTEHVTGGVSYTLSMEAMDVVSRTLIDMGITVPLDQVFNERNRTFQIVDRAAGTVRFAFRDCKVTSVSRGSRKGVLSSYNISMVCISIVDANGVIDV